MWIVVRGVYGEVKDTLDQCESTFQTYIIYSRLIIFLVALLRYSMGNLSCHHPYAVDIYHLTGVLDLPALESIGLEFHWSTVISPKLTGRLSSQFHYGNNILLKEWD